MMNANSHFLYIEVFAYYVNNLCYLCCSLLGQQIELDLKNNQYAKQKIPGEIPPIVDESSLYAICMHISFKTWCPNHFGFDRQPSLPDIWYKWALVLTKVTWYMVPQTMVRS